MPTYDKSAFEGKGDRGENRVVQPPIDLVLFEGWMLGYQPVDESKAFELEKKYPGMATVN